MTEIFENSEKNIESKISLINNNLHNCKALMHGTKYSLGLAQYKYNLFKKAKSLNDIPEEELKTPVKVLGPMLATKHKTSCFSLDNESVVTEYQYLYSIDYYFNVSAENSFNIQHIAPGMQNSYFSGNKKVLTDYTAIDAVNDKTFRKTLKYIWKLNLINLQKRYKMLNKRYNSLCREKNKLIKQLGRHK